MGEIFPEIFEIYASRPALSCLQQNLDVAPVQVQKPKPKASYIAGFDGSSSVESSVERER